MKESLVRTGMLIGEEGIEQLSSKRVAVFGVGGVGGYVCEGLVRSGIGAFDLIDNDTVAESNINRQIIATYDSIGRFKVDVMKERMLSINPNVQVRTYPAFFLPENEAEYPWEEYDYIIDAIDTVTAKIALIVKAKSMGIPVISAMGAGNKLDPTKFVVTDIYKTSVCPLAKVMRRELKKRGVPDCKVVYSLEEAKKPIGEETDARKKTPGSIAFVPSVSGMIIAGEVVKDLIK